MVIAMIVRQPASGHVRATYMLTGAMSRRRRCFAGRALPNLEDALELIRERLVGLQQQRHACSGCVHLQSTRMGSI